MTSVLKQSQKVLSKLKWAYVPKTNSKLWSSYAMVEFTVNCFYSNFSRGLLNLKIKNTALLVYFQELAKFYESIGEDYITFLTLIFI